MTRTIPRTPSAPQNRTASPEVAVKLPEKGSGQGYLAKAVALHLAGKRPEALQQLQRAISANEATPEIYRAMAHIQFEMGDYEDAGKTYRTLTQLKPQYAVGWFHLGVCLERLSAWDDASQAFPQGLHSRPEAPRGAPGPGRQPSAPGRPEVRPLLL